MFTPANRNYQMFAFCSGINKKICGIPKNEQNEETLDAMGVNFKL